MGKARHGDAAYNLLGQHWRCVNEAWTRQPDLWPRGQNVVTARFGEFPIQWDQIERIPPPVTGESDYGAPWHMAILEDEARRGEMHRRNKRLRRWDKYGRELCGALVVPLPPLFLNVTSSKTTENPDDPLAIISADFWDLTVAWLPQQARLQPNNVEWFIQDLLADDERNPFNMDHAYRARFWRGTVRDDRRYEIKTPAGGRRLPDSLYRLWLRNKYDDFGNSPWSFVDFPIGESFEPIPTAPIPLPPTLLLQNSSGVTQTDEIADFSFAELGWQFVSQKNAMGTPPNQIEIEMRGRVNTFRTRRWTNDGNDRPYSHVAASIFSGSRCRDLSRPFEDSRWSAARLFALCDPIRLRTAVGSGYRRHPHGAAAGT